MVERIRTLLESRQLTPTQFADLIGVARPIISHILSGRNKPSLDVVQRILGAMPDLSMAWLLNGAGPMVAMAQETPLLAPAPRAAGALNPAVPAASPQPANQAQQAGAAVQPQSTSNTDRVINQRDKRKAPAPLVQSPPVPIPSLLGSASTSEASEPGAAPGSQLMNAGASRAVRPRRFPIKPQGVADKPEPRVELPHLIRPVAVLMEGNAASASDANTSSLASAAAASAALATKNVEKEYVEALPAARAEPSFASDLAVKATVPGVAPAILPPTIAASVVGLPAQEPSHTAGPVNKTTPTLANDMASALFTGAQKPIRRIVIFYRDGSFADYQPE